MVEETETRRTLDDAGFYPQEYSRLVKITKKRYARDNIAKLLLHEYEDLSRHIDNTKLQDSSIIRNNIRVCRLASLLINDEGEIVFTYYTYGEPEDQELIEPAIRKAEQLTTILRKNYVVKLVFIDGNPMLEINDQKLGTGEEIRTVILNNILQ